ncbi:MAG: VWA-like domain-containing protein [Levilactobacillus sp.]|jgi:predicted metal-dependent peptidase|uniref:vWA domain-containing protein n=1 Tax=Levilactobacillus sp. TaxID=2767919 RepID=UPI00259103BB|nr:VWA-like domain-containing protein [Levilactobacillus sp.]MCH4123428.1 VWA-like domain-containing protein [Levilactobacillus sp.]MCI1552434.1 VWA-like domain-containing protein [Levilactobacillus sp.]MCI1599021.1 VWA-like domain-containing protein [Levilactobacillus sp.]MCI1606063.1 VWA-like domain-containing protein [Levilactobacillus sp.]
MTSLTGDLERLRQAGTTDQPQLAQTLYRHSVLYLLQHDPFYGHVLSRLNVTVTAPLQRAPLGLVPTAREWQLQVQPQVLAQTDWTGAQFLAMLRHTVLHLLWRHPQRYATAVQTVAQAGLVRWATDAAVNDYLTDLPHNAVTSRRLGELLKAPVAPRQDSAVYLRQLRRWQAQQDATDQSLAPGGPAGVDTAPVADGHVGWQTATDAAAETREQWRTQLFQTVASTLSAKQRGTLPGHVQAALQPVMARPMLDWRAVLKRGLGQVPAGRQAAYGRFNRRQPVRMELPGNIVRTWQRVAVFVDESGSMGNQEISYLLGQMATSLAVYPAQVTVYPFDTTVDEAASFRLEKRPQHLSRTGGGGTRFQAVFDRLPRLLAGSDQPLVVILTDGYGEERVQSTLPVTVVWLLTSPVAEFSVVNAPGTVVSLTTDPQWQALRRTRR